MNLNAEYDFRIGMGSDIHRLIEGKKLMLGGVEIPFNMGLLAHSDGDVVIHAVIDSLFGAAGLGDIGMHYPDNDPNYKNVDSKALLSDCGQKLKQKGWEIVNIDITINAEQPKLGNYKGQIKRCLSGLLEMDFADVNVKAKTGEGLGEIGTSKAISSSAIALIRKRIKRTL